MIKYLERENEYIPWKAALDSLRAISNLIIRTPLYGTFRSYVRYIVKSIYAKVGGLSNIKPGMLDFEKVKHKALICTW
jgi:aminopeptidase N